MGDSATDNAARNGLRFYGDLARWWPLISPVADYAEESAYFAGLLSRARIPVTRVLELGSGGGHCAAHLKADFAMTLVDLSPDMLAVSRRINPECAHHLGDMRHVRLPSTFDAVFVHDAVAYMTTREDLRAAMATAFAHLRPGGMALFVPDETAETFTPRTEAGGSDAPDGRGARYVEWNYDLDPDDELATSQFAFICREADGTTLSVGEEHRFGLFARSVWIDLLRSVGFEAEHLEADGASGRDGRPIFLAHRPATPNL